MKTLRTDSQREEALTNLPGLDETYNCMLNQLKGKNDDYDYKVTRKLLTWLLCQARPLTLHELNVVVALEPDDVIFHEKRKLDDPHELVEICGSFVTLNLEENLVELSHSSVRKFLTTKTLGSDDTPNAHYIDERSANAFVLRSCLTYLTFPSLLSHSSDIGTMFSIHPLLHYAIYRWPVHARNAEASIDTHSDDYNCTHLLYSFMGNSCFQEWAEMWQHIYDQDPSNPFRSSNILGRVRGEELGVTSRTGLSFAAQFELFSVLELLLLECASTARSPGMVEINRALTKAVLYGSEKMVGILLDVGGDPNCLDEDWGLLHESVWRGDARIVYDLLINGADVSMRDRRGRTPLDLAKEEIAEGSYRGNNYLPTAQSIVTWLSDLDMGKPLNTDMKKRLLGVNQPYTHYSEQNLEDMPENADQILKGEILDSTGRKRIAVSEGTTTAVFKKEGSAENPTVLVLLIITIAVIVILEAFGSRT